MRGRWILVLLLANAACDADTLTPAEARAACDKDPAAACCRPTDCAQGSVCDFSLTCGQGSDREVRCSPPTGDRQCHATCDAIHPCPTGQTCQTVSIFNASDAADGAMICVAAP